MKSRSRLASIVSVSKLIAAQSLITALFFASVQSSRSQCTAPPTVTIQPQSQTVLGGDPAVFSVRASFSTACPTTYQWQIRFPGDTTFFDIGPHLPDYTVDYTYGLSGAAFRCIVSNAVGAVTTSVATLTVNSGTCTSGATITTQPLDKIVNEGNSVTLSVAATTQGGCALHYQWRYLPSADDGWVDIAGATNTSYTFFPNRDNQYWTYSVGVRNGVGTTESREVFLQLILAGTVVKEAESVTRTSSGASTAVQNDVNTSGGHWIALLADSVGDSVSYTIPNVAAGQYFVKFRYKMNGNRGIAALSIGGISLGQIDQYNSIEAYPQTWLGPVTFSTSGNKVFRMQVAGKNPASTVYTLSADQFILEPSGPLVCTTPPVITVQPQDEQTVLEGTTATLWVAANATPSACQLFYQWRYLPSADEGWIDIPGAYEPQYIFMPTRETEDYSYSVLITSGAGVTESSEARVNLIRAGSFFFEAEALSRTSSGASTAVQNDVNTSGGHWIALLADSVGDSVSYTLPNIPAGEYNVKMKYKAHPNRGILELLVNGAVEGGQLDQYAPSQLYLESFFGQAFYTTTGNKILQLRTVGKNPAAGAFTLSADQFTLAPR